MYTTHASRAQTSCARGTARTTVVVKLIPWWPILAGFHSASAAGQDRGQREMSPQRFDMLVLEDFFSGFAGNSDALEPAMKKCEEILAEDPTNAEALAWHQA